MNQTYRDNLDKVIQDIEDHRINISQHNIVQLVAVSKYSTVENIKEMLEVGQRAFGENKVQDLKLKSKALKDYPIAWHFIGSLQRNKINQLIDLDPFLFHSIDSFEFALSLNKRLEVKQKTMNCLVQVNSAKEISKSGVSPEEAIEIYKKIKKQCPHINLKGVMSIGANSEDQMLINKSFEITKNIFNTPKEDGASICSMGMSGDYKLAIDRGSTMVRVGSALFKN